MVQRKAPQRWLGSQAELKINSHANTSKTNSEQQDPGSRGGAGGGDLKKKMKMERSIIAAELDSLQGFKNSSTMTTTTTTKRPNYMKPTSSSKSRRTENLKPPSKPPKKALKGTARRPSAKKSLRGVVVVSRATCSSTLKDSTFPEALDLAPGGTEAEGTSAARVCPYTYCSLNGHGHEPLPPLRCFVSARRRSLKTQKSTKLRVLSSFKVKGVKAEEEEEVEVVEIDTGQKALARCSSTEQVCNDFFVEIYTTKPAGEQSKPEVEDAGGELGEDDQASSEVSDEDVVDVTMNFLEYIECDRRVEEEEEEEDDKDTLSPEQVGSGSGELHTEKASTLLLGWEDDAERPFPENKAELTISECSEEDFGLPPQVMQEAEDDELLREVEDEDEDDTKKELCGLDVLNLNSNAYKPESSEEDNATEVALSTEDHSKNDTVGHDGPEVQEILVNESTGEEVEDTSSLSIAQLFDDSYDNLSELEQATAEGDRVRGLKCNGDAEDVTSPDDAQNCAYDGQSEREHQENFFNLGESIDEMKARMRITRKKMSEDLEETREFNPRGPRFLPAEPDPDAEKVDLRHQIMDERKNSEEWMIDYALRRAVMKLAPAPKKKVAVLVEAFETVAPLPAWGKPRRHSTPGFSHARIIQACN